MVGRAFHPGEPPMKRRLLPGLLLCPLLASAAPAGEPAKAPVDLIVHHAKVVTLADKFRIAEAVAVKDGRVVALGEDDEIFRLCGPKTRVIDADGQTVLPGLYDSHVHPVGAALSEVAGRLPNLE